MKFQPRVRRPFLIVNLLLAAMFAYFSWLQRDDFDTDIYYHASMLDAILWLAFYLLAAVLLVWVSFRAVPRWLFTMASIACVVAMALTVSGIYENLTGSLDFNMTRASMTPGDPRVELSREFLGALITLAAVSFGAWQNRKFSTKGAK